MLADRDEPHTGGVYSMRIGIISMQRIINYGSFMQALALKEIVESLGHTVEFVDFTPSVLVQYRHDIKEVIRNEVSIKKKRIKSTGLGRLVYDFFRKKQETTLEENFVECYPLLGLEERQKYHKKVDILLVGSDEVFNCLQQNPKVGFAMDFFGKDCRAKKIISYAASFGSTTIEGIEKFGVRKELTDYLISFQNISVRDENSRAIVEELTGKNPMCHLDPVLVGSLETKKWKRPEKKNYLVVYGYKNRFTNDEGTKILRFAAEHNLSVVVLCEPQSFCDNYIPCRPDEILGYIKNADYIVTDTFHGTIFSAIFHKPVAVYCRKVSQTGSTNAEKLLDLIKKLEMSSRLVSEKQTLEEVLLTGFDYSHVEEIRKRERKRTLAYFTANL